ncbi:MAG: helix-turn-helix domain-containing protein [Clostridia bacterium]|nr:helix-turn-helix domain-containing protein [Clostridia bacterium]
MLGDTLKRIRKERGMTLEALATKVGTSRQTIHRYESGIITNVPHKMVGDLARALGVSPATLMGWDGDTSEKYRENIMPISVKRLPILGDIACGEPIYASEEHDSFISTDIGLDADFCLRAHGDSMVGARIYDGDIVFIRAQDSVDNGEIAAVIINDEATLKRVYYYPEASKLILSAENPRYAPFVYVGDELNEIKIIGKAVAFQSNIS